MDKIFPTQIIDGTPTGTDRILYDDGVSAKDCAISALPISDATQTALNSKQGTITLTTTGTSGAATLVGDTLNIPQYVPAGGAVDSVNGQTGVVVLDTDDISEGATNKYLSATDKTDLTDGGDTTLHTHDSRYYTETEVNALVSSTGVILYTLNETITLNGNTYQQTANSQNDSRYNKNTPTELTGPTVTGTGITGAKAVSDAGILTYIPAGPITTNIQIRKVSGSADFTFYSEYYKLSSSGTETLLGTSGTSDQVHSNAFSQFSVTTILPATTFTSTDRLMRKTYYNKVGGGTDPVVGINVEGPTPTFVSVTIPASALSTVNITPITNGSPVDTLTLQDVIRHMRSSGMVEKGVITTNGGAGTIDISANDFVTREGTTSDSPLVVYRDAGVAGLSLPANEVSYIYRDYNNGTPIWATSTSLSGFNGLDKVIAYAVARNGTRMNVLDATEINVDQGRKNRRKDVEWDNYTYNGFWRSVQGRSVFTSSGLNILVGSGKYFWFDNPIAHNAFDTTIAGVNDYNNFIYFYNRTGTWTQITGQKSINNSQYDNAGTLTSLTTNRWRADDLYIVLDANGVPYLAIVMGNAQYTSQATAETSAITSVLPPQIDGIAVYVGRAIIQQGASTYTALHATGNTITGSVSYSNHNSLGGLQGGAAGEYYHLTSTEYTNLLTTDNTKTLTNKTFDDEFRAKQIATPSNPSAGYNKLYFKSDGKLYKLTSGGVESEIGAGGDAVSNTGYLNIPQNSQSTAYTLVLGDAGKHIYHPSADTTARTFTIPANSSVAYPIGTAINFVNDTSAGTLTIAINTDTLVLAGAGTTGSRTLAANGIATAIKVTSTRWIINGTGLS